MQFHGELLRSEKALEVAFAGGGVGVGLGWEETWRRKGP